MARAVERPNRYFTFLRRLRAEGRSNMYGAIPYLAAAFGIDRNESFRIICEWIDAQDALAADSAVPKATVPADRSAAPTLFDPLPPGHSGAAAKTPARKPVARKPVKQRERDAVGPPPKTPAPARKSVPRKPSPPSRSRAA